MRILLVAGDGQAAAAAALVGHDVILVDSLRAVLRALDEDRYDVVLLDWSLAAGGGMALLARLRETGVILPVVMLAPSFRSADAVEALRAGADDYIAPAGRADELAARLHALLRGRAWALAAGEETVRAGDIVVSPRRCRAWRAGVPLDLGAMELKLLAELARHAGTILSRAVLLERVWGYPAATNVVEAHVYRLRARLTARGGSDPIRTVRGLGYMLETHAPPPSG